MYLEIIPGCLVLESGTGSGSLTMSLAIAVAPKGQTFDFHEGKRASLAREDFEKTGLSSLVTVGARDIQIYWADSVFLDLPQPWFAIPSAGKILKEDGVLCSFSPCIEQVQQSCETLKSCFTDIRTFELLLRSCEVREERLESWENHTGGSLGSRKRQQCSTNGSNGVKASISATAMVRPSREGRGHAGYLTFARLGCVI